MKEWIDYFFLAVIVIMGGMAIAACFHFLKLEARKRTIKTNSKPNTDGLLPYERKFVEITNKGEVDIIVSDEKRCLIYSITSTLIYITVLILWF